MKRQVLSTFTIVILLLVFGAHAYHDFPYLGIIMWISAMMVIWYMSLQSIRANASEQKPVPDPYAGLAITGYILGTVSLFLGHSLK